jgi:hypothetical protein
MYGTRDSASGLGWSEKSAGAASLFGAGDVAAGRQESAELSGIEFFLGSFGPRIRSCVCGAVERFSEITPVLLGMKAVHHLDGFRN